MKKFKKVDPGGFQMCSSSIKIFPHTHSLHSQPPTAKLSIVWFNGMDTYQDKLELFLGWYYPQEGLEHLLSAWSQLKSWGWLFFSKANK